MDIIIMKDLHISDNMLYKAAKWMTFEDQAKRMTLQWIGHVARMPIMRRPKQMLFGWWAGHGGRATFKGTTQARWLVNIVNGVGLSEVDWFRQAQDRKVWRKTIDETFPMIKWSVGYRKSIDEWRPGMDLPGNEDIIGEPAGGAVVVVVVGVVPPAAGDSDDGEGVFKCPVCEASFNAGNQMQYHYDESHSVRDPDIVTVICRRCEDCKACFARPQQLRDHICPARTALMERQQMTVGGWLPVRQGPPLPPPEAWLVSTDGSGKVQNIAGNNVKVAGWGAVVFRMPLQSDLPDYILHAPVITAQWSHLWLGARDSTNNTAELTAIGEAMLWLEKEAPDDGTVPVDMHYDSTYAANIAQGIWDPKSNEELAAKVRELTKRIEERRRITWTHVYGHTGVHDNEMADQAADKGTDGPVSDMSVRWAAPPPALEEDPLRADKCRKCGVTVPARDIVWHVRHCTSTAAAIPAGKDQCRKCGVLIKQGTRSIHEAVCRGSDLANRTCSKCGKVFPAPVEGQSCKPMHNHEARCDGRSPEQVREEYLAAARRRVARRNAEIAAGAIVVRRGPRAKAKAKAKGGAKAKAKATPKVKARPKPAAKAKKKTKGCGKEKSQNESKEMKTHF